MRVPLEWLAEYVNYNLPADELAARLTMTGLNVESVERPALQWTDVIVGKIVELNPHARSRNPLNVAKVDVGDRHITVVTGAPNVRLGDKAPVVLVGGSLPHGPDGSPITIEARPMAGITSEGMLSSARELGISDDHSGIYILPPDAPVGAPLASIMGGEVLDIETVSNRPDTLSMIGIAREVAAATGQPLVLPPSHAHSASVEWVDRPSVELRIEVPDLCPRFSALRIEGVSAVPSPGWLASRLEAAGQRPINLLVDLTNYVMLESGQPMHAFDADRLQTDRIVVRRSHDGERVLTLDGTERILPAGAVVVADGDRAVSVAGIIGGRESEITAETTTLLLEAATWNAPNIRFTARALGVRTEASQRFEKGQQPETTVPALLRYLDLLAATSARPLRVSQVSDAAAVQPPPRVVTMPLHDLGRLVGVPITAETAAETLRRLGFEVERNVDSISAVVPAWRRVDIEQSVDLVEEVARLVGFDTLPATLPRRTMAPPRPDAGRWWRTIVRERLLSAGIHEITTHSLTSFTAMNRLFSANEGHSRDSRRSDWLSVVPNPTGVTRRHARLDAVALQNPATTERQILRLSLLPSVLEVVSRNLKQSEDGLAFFELDRTFFRRDRDLPYERETLTIALSGARSLRTWKGHRPGPFTFYDLKGLLEAVLHALQIRDWQTVPTAHPTLHPGRSAGLRIGAQEIAFLGELHPDVARNFELDTWPVLVAEVDLDTMIEAAFEMRRFRELPRYPAAYRDLAVVVEKELPAARLLEVVRRVGGHVLESAQIFDVYAGEQLPSNRKSIAVELIFRSPASTLTQEEISSVMARMVEAIGSELGGSLRD